MKIKKHLVVMLSVCISGTAFSQSFMHSVGGTVSVISAHIKEYTPADGVWVPTLAREYNAAIVQTGATYFPRFNFMETGNTSLSIGVPLSIGVGSSSQNGGEDRGVFFSYDLPVIADFNVGLNSTRENEKSFGFFLGGGFGYNHIGIATDNGSSNINTYGPLIHAGTRFALGRTALMTGLFYKFGMETQKYKTIGIQVLADL